MSNSSCGAFNINIQHKKDSKNAVADLLSLCHFSESYEPGIHSYGKCPWLYFCLFCVLLVCLCRWCGMSVFCLLPFQVQPTAMSLSCIHFIILRTLTRHAPASLPPRAKEWLDGHFQMCISTLSVYILMQIAFALYCVNFLGVHFFCVWPSAC